MGSLQVKSRWGTLQVGEHQTLGFGRTNVERNGQVGWGHEGRFLELGDDDSLHRVWGEFTCRSGMWCVRNLGSLWEIRIVLPTGAPVDLMPWVERERRLGSPADSLGITHPTFEVELVAGPSRHLLSCSSEMSVPAESGRNRAHTGAATRVQSLEAAESITENEFGVLWAMSREYREAAVAGRFSAGADPSPLSYIRIRRMLGLTSDRQATAATERLVKRFRDASLLEGVTACRQRDVMCTIAVHQGVLAHLEKKYGVPGHSSVGAPALSGNDARLVVPQ